MRLLRQDLLITPTVNPPGCSVRDKRRGKVYEFGPVEKFLLTRLREPYRPEDLSKACRTRFEQDYTSQDIENFIQMLRGWELLSEESRLPGEKSDPRSEVPKAEIKESNGQHTAHEAPEAGVPPAGEAWEPDPEDEYDADQTRHPYGTHLFNPQPLFDLVLGIVRPLRYLFWVTPIIFGLGTLAVAFHFYTYVADLTFAMGQFGKIGRITMEGFTILLMDQLARGVMARWLGLPTPSFGIRLIMGIIPRFHVRLIPAGNPDRRNQLLLSGGPMLMRFLVFGLSALVWLNARQSGSSLATVAVEVNYLALIAILLESNPLWRGDGPRFLSALLNVPNIQTRRNRALRGLFFKQPSVLHRYSSRHRIFFALLGLISCTLLVGVFGFVGWNVFLDLQGAAKGTGVALFVLGIGWGIYAVFGTRKTINEIVKSNARRAAQEASVRPPTTREPMGRTFTSSGASGATVASRGTGTRPGATAREGKGRWLKYALLIAFIICLFLPYNYESGGQAQVYPAARATLANEADGLVDKVFFNGGEWVSAGTTLAEMNSDLQVKNLRATEAQLEAQKFDIEKLRTTPLKEQVDLSEAQVEAARIISKYAGETLEREVALFKKKVTSLQDFANYQETNDANRQKYVEAQASLAALKAQVNPNQIAEEEATAEMLKHQIVYYKEELRKTRITTPIDGRIVTKNLQYQLATYLKAGTTFAVVEDTRTVPIEIAVPESDLGGVAVGAR